MSDLTSTELDYRGILLESFNARRTKNPGYSMRAFARDIEISHSRLSEIFSGKGELSLQKAQVIAKKLNLSAMRTADFKDMVVLSASTDPKEKESASKRLLSRVRTPNQKDLTEDQFQIVANPKCSVVYTCMMLEGYDGEVDFLLKVLDLSSIELYEIMRRLERLGLVSRDGSRWVAHEFKIKFDHGIPSEWGRTYHKEMATLGRRSIDNAPMTLRHLNSIVLPIDMERFGEIQQKIGSFCQSLLDEYCTGKDAVYGLSLQLFPMSKTPPVK